MRSLMMTCAINGAALIAATLIMAAPMSGVLLWSVWDRPEIPEIMAQPGAYVDAYLVGLQVMVIIETFLIAVLSIVPPHILFCLFPINQIVRQLLAKSTLEGERAP